MSVGTVVRLEAFGRSVSLGFEDPEDHIARSIIRSKRFYEADLLEDARKRMDPGLVVDVGAHVGNHSLWFAKVCDASVVAFEPNPRSFAQLVENVKLNGADVRTLPVALGAWGGYGRLEELQPGNSGMTRVVPDETGGPVQIAPLDSFGLTEVSVVKIDAEDSECDVLRGAAQTLRKSKPLLYVEARTSKHRFRIEALLEELGLGYRLMAGPFGWTPTWCYA